MKSIILKKFISVFIFLGIVIQFFSCYRTEYKFIHKTSEIISIQIVENRYTIEENMYHDYQNVLVSIDNIDMFLKEFKSIPYTMPLYNGLVYSFSDSELGIKFTYSNGDYEILSSGVYSLVYKIESEYDHAVDGVIGFFDEEQFDALVSKYLEACEKPVFFFMHDKKDILSVEIIDAYVYKLSDGSLEFSYNNISEVKVTSDFLNDLSVIDYNYTLQEWENGGNLKENEHRNIIKITYINGDYEIFDNDWRSMYNSKIDTYFHDAYIGEFDKDQFDALIEKYS